MLALFWWSVAVVRVLFFKSADTSKTLQKEQRYATIAVAYLWFWGDSMECILHTTRKRIVAICFSAFNTIMVLSHFGPLLVVLFQNFEHTAAYLPIYLMPLITPIPALVFFLTPKKEYRLKRWLLPLAFGIAALRSCISLSKIFSSLRLYIYNPQCILLFVCPFLMVAAYILAIIGTLSFKYIHLLKVGALGCAIVSLATVIINFVLAGGFAYLQSVPADISPINIEALLLVLSDILFYMSFYILTADKKTLG